jgi:hypothetical protein
MIARGGGGGLGGRNALRDLHAMSADRSSGDLQRAVTLDQARLESRPLPRESLASSPLPTSMPAVAGTCSRSLRSPSGAASAQAEAVGRGEGNPVRLLATETRMLAENRPARETRRSSPTPSAASIDLRAIVLGLLDDPEIVTKLRSKIDRVDPQPINDYETIAETALRYRLSTRTIRRAMARGLPHERPLGRRVRIPVSKAREWFESGKGRNLEKTR